MKKIILSILVLLLAFGCVTQQTEKPVLKSDFVGEVANNTIAITQPIKAVQQGNISIIRISALENSAKPIFALNSYPGQFGDVELYSDSFIQFNRTHISWLDYGERIWLTPMLKDNHGVIFNAIYSRDIENCNQTKILILGKEYSLDKLKEGVFDGDGKWKARVAGEGTTKSVYSSYMDFCPKRVVIYLDGYFSNLSDNEQINLFRNDNTILLEFNDLEANPSIEVIATKPAVGIKPAAAVQPVTSQTKNETNIPQPAPPSQKTVASYNITIDDFASEETITTDASGSNIELRMLLPVMKYQGSVRADTYYTKIVLPGDDNWVLARYWEYNGSEELVLGKEISNVILVAADQTPIVVGGRSLTFYGWDYGYNIMRFRDESSNSTYNISKGSVKKFGNEYLKVWTFVPHYILGASWVNVSVLSDVYDLTDPANMATAEWVFTSEGVALTSIKIDSNSPILKKK